MRCTRCKNPHEKYFSYPSELWFFENHDFPVNTVRENPLNCDTEESQKIHSFGQKNIRDDYCHNLFDLIRFTFI